MSPPILAPYYTNVTIRSAPAVLHLDPDMRFELQSELISIGGPYQYFIHLNVYKTSPSAIRDMKRLWEPIRQQLPPIIYALPRTDDEKYERFMRMYGWEPGRSIACRDGITRRLFLNIRPDIALKDHHASWK